MSRTLQVITAVVVLEVNGAKPIFIVFGSVSIKAPTMFY
jgi:hypothetical protein